MIGPDVAKGAGTDADSLKSPPDLIESLRLEDHNPAGVIVIAQARIVILGDRLAVAYLPFELRRIPEAFPRSQWQEHEKGWVLDATFANSLADALRAGGACVYVTTRAGEPWSGSETPHGHRATPSVDWLAALHGLVGVEAQNAIYRAVRRCLTAYLGGDPRALRALNAARLQAIRRVSR